MNQPLIAAVFVLAIPVFLWQIRRAAAAVARVQADLDVVLAEQLPRAARPRIDTRPGINLADLDECERIWSMPAYLDPGLAAGLDQLRAAVRDEQQQEGGQA
ncbi:hypothetical protein ACWDA7_38835 [Streptomyces sp. NPDC001156]